MSRNKIQEYLLTWLNFKISTGLICKSIREAGIACYPVMDELIDDLQTEDKVHLDETPWYQKGVFCWLWVAISKGSRALAAQLSVMETCRLRNVDPWDYIAKAIACGRKGLNPPSIA